MSDNLTKTLYNKVIICKINTVDIIRCVDDLNCLKIRRPFRWSDPVKHRAMNVIRLQLC